MMFAAVTDHVFVDGGHTIDFTNKAFEALDHLGTDAAPQVLPTLVQQTTSAQRSEEFSEWRHPHDLVELGASAIFGNGDHQHRTFRRRRWPSSVGTSWPTSRARSSTRSSLRTDRARPTRSSGARSRTRPRCASCGSTCRTITATGTPSTTRSRRRTRCIRRCTRQSDAGTAARLCACGPAHLSRPFPQRSRGATSRRANGIARDARPVLRGARSWSTKPATRPTASCTRAVHAPNSIAALGHALLVEDAEFHWFQTVEAGVRQALAWPEGSEESALVLVAVARFLAAHTPTRRELPTVARIAARLRRGEALYEDA